MWESDSTNYDQTQGRNQGHSRAVESCVYPTFARHRAERAEILHIFKNSCSSFQAIRDCQINRKKLPLLPCSFIRVLMTSLKRPIMAAEKGPEMTDRIPHLDGLNLASFPHLQSTLFSSPEVCNCPLEY